MASVSSTSSATSIYGTRNVISGLASGLDTETLIENAISSYKNKINALGQKRTKVEWQQEAYRSIINKMSVFSDKYASYQSSNNLMSTSFFNQAVQTVTKGANASKVSATGRTNSSVSINGVRQLATAARYTVGGGALKSAGGSSEASAAAGVVDLDNLKTSTFTGNMTLGYGSTTLSLSFKDSQIFENVDDLVSEINKQLEEQTISFSSGGSVKASERVQAVKNGSGGIIFKELGGANNGVYIKSVTGDLKDEWEIPAGERTNNRIDIGGKALNERVENAADFFSETPLTITLDGVTKSVKMPTAEEIAAQIKGDPSDPAVSALLEKIRSGESIDDAESRQLRDQAYIDALQKNIDTAFGAGKLTVSDKLDDTQDDGQGLKLEFTAKNPGSTFQIKSDKGDFMDLGDNGLTSYLDTASTLGKLDILDESMAVKKKVAMKDKDGNVLKDANGNIQYEKDENGDFVYEKDKDGNFVYETDDNGNKLYSFVINGVEIGQFTEESTLGSLINKINGNKEAGVNVSYSKTTNDFTFTSKETGVAGKIEFGDGLAQKLFGTGIPEDLENSSDYTKTTDPAGNTIYKNNTTGAEILKGQDAIFTATINGKEMEMTRSSNIVDMDGMTVTLKDTFGYYRDEEGNFTNKDGDILGDGQSPVLDRSSEAVTFETSADADKIVDVVKQMVEDYNAMVTEIKNAYSTLPVQRSSGAYYQPLTDDDKADMSESAIAAWEEKAKTGILFGDNDLRALYTRLTKAISMTGQDGADLKAAGITMSYSNGLTTLDFNETQLRETLSTDPDRVMEIFTKSKENGAESDGIMAALKEPLDLYGKTTGVNLSTGAKGVLVAKAGSPLAPSTMYTNTIQQQLDKIDEEIEKWQDKMSDQVDYYTAQFSQLEQLVSQMNSQSSYFSQLMGG